MMLAGTPSAQACIGCCAVVVTFSEEMALADVVALGKVIPPASSSTAPLSATFEIVQILKGKGLAKKLPDRIEIPVMATARAGELYLLIGDGPQTLTWSTPYPASRRLASYLREVLRLPKQGPERLAFYYKHLGAADEMIARDASDELVAAPYAQIRQLKGVLNRDQLVTWISDEQTPTSRRRLYLTMLGVCGSARDVPMLERFLRSKQRADTRGLESLLACYLTLRGAAGLQLVEELYLANSAAEYPETYSAIQAIRFHLRDEAVIPKSRLVASLRLMLQRPNLADLVVPDLAKAADWESIDRLLALYRDAEPKESWVRVPVVNYLRACPLPRAKDDLLECETIDPAAVERAHKTIEFSVPTAKAKR
jgi:hypothetical protein